MKLFTSATLRLAGWYLLILMTVSILFSTIILQVARTEIGARLHGFAAQQQLLTDTTIQPASTQQLDVATNNLLVSLGYLNVTVLLAGGAGAYLLARWTLLPIKRAHDAQSRFVSNASHQLRTPLAIMRAETELALSDPRTPKADLRHTLQSNLEEINHLTDVSTMLLELSRTESDLQMQNEEFDVVKLVKTMVHDRHVDDRVTVKAPESLQVLLHHAATRELFAILIDNALKHSPEQSLISIQLKHSKGQLTCIVTNAGRIKTSDLPHVFERFYQAKQQAGNYGLGLSLAKQLTRTLGGSISVKSTKKTTSFTISLPTA